MAHTPDLYAIMRIMGTRRVTTRLNDAKMWLELRLES